MARPHPSGYHPRMADGNNEQVDARLAAVELKDAQGNTVRLGDMWARQPAVVVWVRHFGCTLCREQASEVRARIPDIRSAGAAVVIVGSGAAPYAHDFIEKMELGDVPVLSDEKLESYKLAGLRRGMLSMIHPRAALNFARALRRGHRQGKTMGDQQQQGGVLVVASDGKVAFRYVSEVTGDLAPLDDVIAAAARVASTSGAGAPAAR
jgi:peroxiredoxin